jgi:hypothetical protein
LYYWAGAEYQLGLALAMNKDLRSYIDTRLAMDIFMVLPAEQKQTIGVKLLEGVLRINPFNPEIWYRLAQHTPDAMQGLKLVQAAMNRDPRALGDELHGVAIQDSGPVAEATKEYWETLEEFVTQYAILAHPPPRTEADMHRVYALLRSAHGINVGDLITYVDRFAQAGTHEPEPEAVKCDQDLASEGDAFVQLRMGQRYEDGQGVQKDEDKARALFAKAAVQGDMVAALAWEKLFAFIPANLITVNASSVFSPDQIARHLVDGSGMVGAVHDNSYAENSMWQSIERPATQSPAPGLVPSPAWVRFDFAQPQKFESILIWNHN